MHLLWEELRTAVPLIWNGDPYLLSIIWFTLEVAAIATAVAIAVGLPLGLAIALERFPGRRVVLLLANAGLALPPVLAGLFLFLIFVPQGPLGSLQLNGTRNAVFVGQSVLALPYVVAFTAAAVQGLPPGLLAQARAFGAGRHQLWVLALREARVGVIAGVIAALGTTLAEVGAVVLLGGNSYGYDQTLASASLYYAGQAHYAEAVAVGIVLVGLILLLMGGVSLLQQQGSGIRLRFRAGEAAG